MSGGEAVLINRSLQPQKLCLDVMHNAEAGLRLYHSSTRQGLML